jgi:lysine-N-methylase
MGDTMPSWPKATRIIAPRYVERFACTGAACSDHCCAGWHVPVDEGHYYQLRKAMGGSRAERQEFRAAHLRNRELGRSAASFAFLTHDAAGNCAMLDAAWLCRTQARHGEEALPDTCSVYPREIGVVGGRAEVFATLSCPEAARLCLLADDALELDELDHARAPRALAQQALAAEPAPYERYLDDVRTTWMRLLAPGAYPLRSRLFFCVSFADATRPFFAHGQPVDETRLAQAIRAHSEPAQLQALHDGLAALAVSPEVASALVFRVLRARMTASAPTAFHRLVAAALAPLKEAPQADLLASYVRRRDSWSPALAARIDQYFTNYALNHFLKQWYVGAPDLLAYVRHFLARLAVVRFVFFNHPRVVVAADLADEAAAARELDDAAVDTIYKFSRAVDHHAAFLAALDAGLSQETGDGAFHAALLACF